MFIAAGRFKNRVLDQAKRHSWIWRNSF